MYKRREKICNKYIYTPFGLALNKCNLIRKNIKKYKEQKGGSIIKEGIYEFNIISENDDETINIIILGDNHRKCFSAVIHNEEKNIVILDYFGFSEICSINKNMDKINGTRSMMKALIKYIKQHHLDVNKILLNDEARKKCKINDEIIYFTLYDYYMLKYREPYYMKHFGFRILGEFALNKYNLNKSIIEKYNMESIIDEQMLNNLKETIKLNEHINYNKFMDEIKNKKIIELLDMKNLDCYLYFSFIDYLCRNINKYSTQLGVTYELDISLNT
jgi:hypothetical protein